LAAVDSWDEGIAVPRGIMLNTGRKIVPEAVFQDLLKQASTKWSMQGTLSVRPDK
jgi:hypothetical protein